MGNWDSEFPSSPQFLVGFGGEMGGERMQGTAGIETRSQSR